MRSPRLMQIGGALLALGAILFVLFSYRTPPLVLGGGVVGIAGKADDRVNAGWNLHNRGWLPVRVTEVTIEGYDAVAPLWTAGAVGTHALMVGSSMSSIPQEDGYLLYPLGSFTVPPDWRLPVWENATPTARTLKAPRNYGLITRYMILKEGQHPLARSVTIRYRYLGLPMTLHHVFGP
ncbi:MAG: hypothetical protein ACOY94_15220 [Bacillota bacterium]